MAGRHCFGQIVKLLLERRADVNSEGQTPLSSAASLGRLGEVVVKLLLDRHDAGADSNDNNGRTPPFHASEMHMEHPAVVKLRMTLPVVRFRILIIRTDLGLMLL
jgi:Ankyrin repeats (3 copies)